MSKLSKEEKNKRSKASKKAYYAANKEKEKAKNKAYRIANKEKVRAWGKAWHAENRGRILDYDRKRHLKRKYGLTLEDYERMFRAQDGRCKLCGKREKKAMLPVDHNHFTKKVRALLCRKCNTGLGQFDDDPKLLRKAAAYIEEHN